MTASPPITIKSTELRSKVEESLGKIPDELWNRAEKYARRKLDSCRERWPDVDYFDNTYLVLLTEDTVKETAFSDYTIAVSAMIMEAREETKKGAKHNENRKNPSRTGHRAGSPAQSKTRLFSGHARPASVTQQRGRPSHA